VRMNPFIVQNDPKSGLKPPQNSYA
jgi:hypothetical protein